MNTQREGRGWCGRPRGETGAALIEFALIFPVFMSIVLGMFSGGASYNRKISMTNAAAEASRYGATLAPGPLPFTAPDHGLDTWLRKVADAVIQNADGDLDVGIDRRTICVAYVHPDNSVPLTVDSRDDKGHSLKLTSNGSTDTPSPAEGPTAKCFDDGLLDSDRRVQIEVSRPSPLNALFFSYDVTLTSRSVTRFEALP